MATDNETVAKVLDDFAYLITIGDIGKNVATDIKNRIEATHRREIAELKTAYDRAVSADARHAVDNERLKREVAELKSKMNDVVCENEALRDACGTCSVKREVAELREFAEFVEEWYCGCTCKTTNEEREDGCCKQCEFGEKLRKALEGLNDGKKAD